MTQEQSNQNECQILIYSVQDFLARHSLSPESEKDLQMQEELSFFEIARILEAKRPSYFILENVPGLLSHDKGRTFCTILSTLSELGYHVEWKVLNSKDFGVPQARKRVYIVGYFDFRCAGKVLPEPETNGAALVQVRAGSQGKESTVPKD